jgi:hypothetical protein
VTVPPAGVTGGNSIIVGLQIWAPAHVEPTRVEPVPTLGPKALAFLRIGNISSLRRRPRRWAPST